MSEWANVGPGHYERDYGNGCTATLLRYNYDREQWEWSARHGPEVLGSGYRDNSTDAGEAADECVRSHQSPAGYAALAGIGAAFKLAMDNSHARYLRDLTAIRNAISDDGDEDGGTLTLHDIAAKVASAMHNERADAARRNFDEAIRRALGNAAAREEGES